MNPSSEIVHFRLQRINYCILASIVIILMRLFYLQIGLADHFTHRGQRNFLRMETIYAPRGSILDCNGEFIATNRPLINVCWIGKGNKSLSSSHIEDLRTLCTLINTGSINPELPNTSLPNTGSLNAKLFETPESLKPIIHAEQRCKEAIIARDITLDQLSKISELFPHHPHIKIKSDFERFYPYGSYASHILGYVSRRTNDPSHQLSSQTSYGKTGLEHLLEQTLQGTSGKVVKTVNSFGKHIGLLELSALKAGDTIQTTINIRLQEICEKALEPYHSGTIILMSPLDGSIRALVSHPNFDPNMFLSPVSTNEWVQLQQHSPFINRAFDASYPPGSIFKLITVSAALEHGIISPEEEWYCKGYSTLGKNNYWCHLHTGHGKINTVQAMAQSCNTFFYEIGKKIDVDTLAHYAHIFGLGKPTHIAFPEKTGLVPSRNWKQKMYGERWWPGETLSVAIGQSFLLVTPMQVTRMIASIFTGYLVKPRTLVSELVEQMPLAIQPDTREFLKQSMKKVVTTGTGRRLNRVSNIEVYAKTSTAQTSSSSNRHLGTKHLEHGWFVGYFKYKEEEPLAITVLLENAETAQRAATVARNILTSYKQLMDKLIA